MRKSPLIFLTVIAALAIIIKKPDIADPVRVKIGSVHFKFPAKILPRIYVGGAANPAQITSHWYRQLSSADGTPLEFGYIQSKNDSEIEAISVEIKGADLSKLPDISSDQKKKISNVDFVGVAFEKINSEHPSISRFCSEISATDTIFVSPKKSDFSLQIPMKSDDKKQTWLSTSPPILITCSEQLPMREQAWGLACYFFKPLTADMWISGRIYENLTPKKEWSETLRITTEELNKTYAGPKLPGVLEVHVNTSKSGLVCSP